MAKKKEQSLQMQLMPDAVERSGMNLWPLIIQTENEGHLNMGDT